jgi:hypothetical protein
MRESPKPLILDGYPAMQHTASSVLLENGTWYVESVVSVLQFSMHGTLLSFARRAPRIQTRTALAGVKTFLYSYIKYYSQVQVRRFVLSILLILGFGMTRKEKRRNLSL